jgi:hypothetical protein
MSYEVPKAEGLGFLGIGLWTIAAAVLIGSIAGLIDLARWLL